MEIVLTGLSAFLETAFEPDGASGEGTGYWMLLMTRSFRGLPKVVPLAWLLVAGSAFAVGTRTFQLDDGDDLKGGDLQGVAVDSVTSYSIHYTKLYDGDRASG